MKGPWWANIYRAYYRIYYYLYARKILQHPKKVEIPKHARMYAVRPELDAQGRQHMSFLHVSCPHEVGAPNRWRFKRRKFAFSNDNGRHWWALPSMTPWDWKNVLGVWEIRYGLNQFFVQKHIKYGDLDKLTFMAWDGK